jgi:geranylgeranyl pyrophosphate synthase
MSTPLAIDAPRFCVTLGAFPSRRFIISPGPSSNRGPSDDATDPWPASFSLAELRSLLGPEADAEVAAALGRTVNAPLHELLLRGGQRWRVPIGRLAYAACGGAGEPPAALGVIELLHTASLVIDDIQDGSATRRGGPAAHVAHGIPIALGAANAAYFRALALLRDALPPALRLRAYDMLAAEMFAAHLGQALDLGLASRPDASTAADERHYDVLARAKTGALVRIAARLGAIAAAASEADERALSDWAGEIGLAYQIRDDLEDAAGAAGDIEAGRLSYAVVAAQEPQGAPTGSVEDRCRAAARRALARGLAALGRLPPSAARDDLVRLSERLAGS